MTSTVVISHSQIPGLMEALKRMKRRGDAAVIVQHEQQPSTIRIQSSTNPRRYFLVNSDGSRG